MKKQMADWELVKKYILTIRKRDEFDFLTESYNNLDKQADVLLRKVKVSVVYVEENDKNPFECETVHLGL